MESFPLIPSMILIIFSSDFFQLSLRTRMTKTKVEFRTLPTENKPKKSQETFKPCSRPAREIVKDIPTSIENMTYYTGLKDVWERIKALKTISEWIVEETIDRVILRKIKDCFQLPGYRKDSCISRTFLLTFCVKNRGCGLYTIH